MLVLPTEIISQIRTLINPASRVLILAHKSPDADTVGGATALARALVKAGKNATVFCMDALPFALQRIPGSQSITADPADLDTGRYDVIIAVDIADPRMVGFRERWMQAQVPIINIDHHATNSNFGAVNLVVPAASSVCELLFQFFREMGWAADADIATALLHGILIDTGGFSNRGTTAGALHVTGELLLEGASYNKAFERLFGHAPLGKLQLWGRAFSRLRHDPEKKITMTCVLQDDFIACAAEDEHAEGIANYLNGLSDSDMVCIWREHSSGEVKASLRTTREHMNVASVAQQFAGGGHTKAAGFSFPGKIVQKDNTWEVQHDSGEAHPFFVKPHAYISSRG